MYLWVTQVLQDSRELEAAEAKKYPGGNEDKVTQIQSCLTVWFMQIEKASLLEMGCMVYMCMLKEPL